LNKDGKNGDDDADDDEDEDEEEDNGFEDEAKNDKLERNPFELPPPLT
jgi:hypothetical protein